LGHEFYRRRITPASFFEAREVCACCYPRQAGLKKGELPEGEKGKIGERVPGGAPRRVA